MGTEFPGPGGPGQEAADRREQRDAALPDQLDARIAAALQTDSRTSWRDVARAVGCSDSTVARRAKALEDARLIRMTMLVDPQRCGHGYPVLLQLSCRPGSVLDVARRLAGRDDVRAATVLTGNCDLLVELIVPSTGYLSRVLLEEIPRVDGISRMVTESVLHQFKSTAAWGRQQLPEHQGDAAATALTEVDDEPPDLDAVDVALLDRLSADGRRSYARLAEELAISQSSVRRRVRRLLDRGCLQPVALIDSRLFGYQLDAFVWLKIDLAMVGRAATALARDPRIRYLAATSGYADLTLEATLRSQEDLYRFRTEVLGRVPGIRSADFALELETVKRGFMRFDRAD